MKRLIALVLLAMARDATGASSKLAVVGSLHDLTASGGAPVKSAEPDACIFCHAPHNVTPSVTPLWDQTLSVQTYTTYTSSTYQSGTQTPGATSSKLCLSCHDGTVATGLTVSQGKIPTTGSMTSNDVFGSNLATSHPVSMTPANDGQLVSTLFGKPPTTRDPAVLLVSGKVECTTCHDPHVPNKDPVAQNFLVRSNAGGTMCLACHDPSQPQPNALAGWTGGAHTTATNTVPANANFGYYGNVQNDACSSCHGAHQNGTGPRNVRFVEEAGCSPCHGGANISPAIGNIMGEYTKAYTHPTTLVSGAHDAAESLPVNSTRHAECVDCHNSHAATAQTALAVAPALPTTLAGVSGYDTAGAQVPATSEHQVCYKCHADSTNKPAVSIYGRTPARYPQGGLPSTYTQPPPLPADQYNLRLKFESTIGHNVAGHSIVTTSNSTLRPYMLDVNNVNILSRPLSTTTQLYCTDCHNNNAARSVNGSGPDGPHGSTFPHLLEFNLYQEPAGGGSGNTAAGYALCSKCHNLTNLNNIAPHSPHARYGCTTCHDPHGVIGGNPVTNRAMMNFDTGVVSKATTYFGYFYVSSSTRGCYVTCHGERHNPYGYSN
ncbi:MAG: hypothetical protein KGN84_19225 [Acidobacteriota bacterium]|nr:hypothetical protein [Acidobacteriota bacterium]